MDCFLQVKEAILNAYPELESWTPEVEYFQHEQDGSLLAHIVAMQPYDDFDTVANVMENINNYPNKSQNIGPFSFGGILENFANLCTF